MVARFRGVRLDRRDIKDLRSFNGQFASLFPGAYQVVQTDLGLTYGGTPLATAGNTSTTVLAITGSLATVPVPIWAKATNTLAIGAGAQFNIYYDGLGFTPAMAGVTPTAGVPVALTGAGTGLSIAWAAGSSVNNNSWKATCSALADQTANGWHYSQAAASKQPVITVGLNGKVGLLFDGLDDFLQSTLVTVFPYKLWAVFRTGVAGGQCTYFGPATGSGGITFSSTGSIATNIQQFSGNVVNPTTGPLNTWIRLESGFTNTVADYLRVGSAVAVSGGNAGSNVRADAQIASNTGSQAAPIEFLAGAWLPGGVSTASADAALNTSAGYGVGSIAA